MASDPTGVGSPGGAFSSSDRFFPDFFRDPFLDLFLLVFPALLDGLKIPLGRPQANFKRIWGSKWWPKLVLKWVPERFRRELQDDNRQNAENTNIVMLNGSGRFPNNLTFYLKIG